MWTIVKILGGTLLLLVLVAPITALAVKVARRIGDLVHEWRMARVERDAAWAEMRRKELSWHGPDERGFLGVLYDMAQDVFHDADSGARWKGTDKTARPDPDQLKTATSQRLYSAMAGVKIEKKDAAAVAQQAGLAKVKFEAETLLNEPAAKVEREDVQT